MKKSKNFKGSQVCANSCRKTVGLLEGEAVETLPAAAEQEAALLELDAEEEALADLNAEEDDIGSTEFFMNLSVCNFSDFDSILYIYIYLQ